jgi:hypothetical protein
VIRQVFKPRLQIDLPIAWLSVSIEDIVRRFSLQLEDWNEDGLGRARGVVVQIDDGHKFALVALDHLQGVQGPHFEVVADGMDIIAVGVDALVDEVTFNLSISPERVIARNHHALDTAVRWRDVILRNQHEL